MLFLSSKLHKVLSLPLNLYLKKKFGVGVRIIEKYLGLVGTLFVLERRMEVWGL